MDWLQGLGIAIALYANITEHCQNCLKNSYFEAVLLSRQNA
ncbi:MAG: hypothetical protein V7K85_08750 [Nostoc sp.]